MIDIIVNGNVVTVPEKSSLDGLLKQIIPVKKIRRIALNGEELSRKDWSYILESGDKLDLTKEIFQQTISVKSSGYVNYFKHCRKSVVEHVKEVQLNLRGRQERTEVVDYGGKPLQFYTPTLAVRRRSYFNEKEPETMLWISQFKPKSKFWDVGANIGACSLYAATNGTETLAFEPLHRNYAVLTENVRRNKLDTSITALNIALGGDVGSGKFNVMRESSGASGNNLQKTSLPEVGESIARYSQSVLTMTVDFMIGELNYACPNYIKIDVDGTEEEILQGSRKTLSRGKIEELSIEIDLLNHGVRDRVVELIGYHGYGLKQIGGVHMTSPTSLPRGIGHCFNYLFARDSI